VATLQGGKGFMNRMASLGFTPGAEVQVVQNYRHGPIIALVRGARVALGRRESLRVGVEQPSNDHEQRTAATSNLV
jgi:ferrous iron transport protein A